MNKKTFFLSIATLLWMALWAAAQQEVITYGQFSRDGQRLFVRSMQEALYVIDPTTGAHIKKIEVNGSALKIEPNGDFIASLSLGELLIWRGKNYEIRHRLPFTTGEMTRMALSPRGDILAVAKAVLNQRSNFDGGKIVLWDTATGDILHTLREQEGAMISPVFSPDGKYLASGSLSILGDCVAGALKLWDVKTGKLVRQYNQRTTGISGVLFSADGHLIIAQHSRGMCDGPYTPGAQWGLWNANTGGLIMNFRTSVSRIHSIKVLPTGMVLIGKENCQAIYDPKTGLNMLDNIPLEIPLPSPILARSDERILIRGEDGIRLEDSKGKVIKRWTEFK